MSLCIRCLYKFDLCITCSLINQYELSVVFVPVLHLVKKIPLMFCILCDLDSSRVFSVTPATLDIPPLKSAPFTVTFRPVRFLKMKDKICSFSSLLFWTFEKGCEGCIPKPNTF